MSLRVVLSLTRISYKGDLYLLAVEYITNRYYYFTSAYIRSSTTIKNFNYILRNSNKAD